MKRHFRFSLTADECLALFPLVVVDGRTIKLFEPWDAPSDLDAVVLLHAIGFIIHSFHDT